MKINDAALQVSANYKFLALFETDKHSWCVVDDIVSWILERNLEVFNIIYDPRLTPYFIYQKLESLSNQRYCLVPTPPSSSNLIDEISEKQTNSERSTLTPIWKLDLSFAGDNALDKINLLRYKYLMDENINYTLVVTAMDEIAWLLNLRANDMISNPLFYGFMVISKDRLIIFTDNQHEVSCIVRNIHIHSSHREKLLSFRTYLMTYVLMMNFSDLFAHW